MPRFNFTFAAISIVLLFGGACSGTGRSIPSAPSPDTGVTASSAQPTSDVPSNHYLWAYFRVCVDPAANHVEIMPFRDISGHLNVLQFLEKGPCNNCVSIVGVTPTPQGTKKFDVKIRHPFASLNFTGFDVRGIAMFKGSHTFPVTGLTTPDHAAGDGELVNADGYTTLYNSGTMGSGPGGLEGYVKGKFASSTMPDATLNGYKRYITSNPANKRNAFYGGDEITATFELAMPTTAFIFGYAVDASWMSPTVKPVTDPMTQFPPSANCPEPWKLDISENPTGQGLTNLGGKTVVIINIYDWQGKDSYHTPIVECPELFDGSLSAIWYADIADYSQWYVEVDNTKLAPVGTYKLLVKVEDHANDTSSSWLDLSAYQVHTLKVAQWEDWDAGWAKTWGGTGTELVFGVAVDPSRNIFVAGSFEGTVDFDPGPGVAERTSQGSNDAFLSKFSPTGDLLWVDTWGGSGGDWVSGLALDWMGNAHVCGSFQGTVDFDPGTGVHDVTASGSGTDAFYAKYDPDVFPRLRDRGDAPTR